MVSKTTQKICDICGASINNTGSYWLWKIVMTSNGIPENRYICSECKETAQEYIEQAKKSNVEEECQ